MKLKRLTGLVEHRISDRACEELQQARLKALQIENACHAEVGNEIKQLTELADHVIKPAQEASRNASIKNLQVCLQCHGNGQAMGGLGLVIEPREALAQDLQKEPWKIDSIRDYLRGFLKNGSPVTRMPIGQPAFSQETQDAIIRDLELIKVDAPQP